ncbi:hypothetical protein AB0B45_06940 [Nonomuraea sp. NPDC049152]|uniref:hypothetical protein n=1 Tax=Nonomuraea sp. NPDC049152 TaxID=3154350 RepID=UPI00340C1888
MSSHLRHVRRLLDEGRFPWAHAYVDRLISDSPHDPEPWLLRALILDRQGRPNGEAVRRAEELGGDYSTLKAHVSVPGDGRRPWWDGWAAEIATLVVLGGLVAPMVWLGVPLRSAGPGDWALFVYLAVILVLHGSTWWGGVRRERLSVRAVVRSRRAASRVFYAGLDDAGLRRHVGGPARFLCVAALIGAMGYGWPPIGDRPLVLRLSVIVVGVTVSVIAWQAVGAGPLRRALRVSWIVSLNAVLAVVWLAVSLFAPGWDAGPYLLVWALVGWLPPLIARVMALLS